MRERWTRNFPNLNLGEESAAELLRPALGQVRVRHIAALTGGHSNTNLRVELDSPPFVVVLRLFQRDPQVVHKEAAIARLLSGTVSAPRYLHIGDHSGRSYAVVDFVEGETLVSFAKRASGDELSIAGRSVGAELAAIHRYTFEQAGFLDGELKVAPFPAGMMLAPYLRNCLAGIAGKRLGGQLAGEVVAYAERNEHRLEVWREPPRLTHFDFGGSNILVREDGSVAGVVDWEFAASASPAADFGNLLRPPLGKLPAFVAGVQEAYREAGGLLPPDWRELTRIADLGAWVEFLTREVVGDVVIADARKILSETIASPPP